jgi:hypothetical protein
MSPRLIFPDDRTAADALTFAQRASRLGDGAVRLRADRGILAMTSAPLAAESLLDETPTVLGMRLLRVDPEVECDLVVDAAALGADADARAVRLPDSAVSAPWAGVSPPRGGWVADGAVDAADLAAAAARGIAQVAGAVPVAAGEEAVRTVRAAVWGSADPALSGLPAGVAFAAYALGFVSGAEAASVHRNGPWTRITLRRGHVLVRSTVRVGLTPVRTTGAL